MRAKWTLLTQFGVLSVVALALLGVALGQVLEAQISKRARATAEEAAALVARAGVQANLRPIDLKSGFSTLRLEQLDQRLHVEGFGETGIERVKIFDATPKVIYSDRRETIGDSAAASDEVQRALNGEVVSKFVRGVGHTGRGERVLEVMVPLRFAGIPEPLGVYEVYLSYARTEAAIAEDTRTMYAVIIGGLALVWAALYRIVAIASRRLRHQALHDALTGLPNRVLLEDRVGQALAAAERTAAPVAVLIIDLDRFKEVNDTLGHSYGDELLRQVAPRLTALLRSADTVARLGGDEFAVLLPAVDGPDGALTVAERLRQELHRSFKVDGMTLDVEASIGVALSRGPGTTVVELLRDADVAMYAAKERKAGAVLFQPDVHDAGPERLAVLGDLRRALDDDAQLHLHYQPKYALDDERVVGLEALLRWQHPVHGNVPPGEFIPTAEESGIILPLTYRVLRLALEQSRRWIDAGHEVTVAVNLSTRCLLDTRFPRAVEGLLTRHGVPARLLRLEVTESAVMSDAPRAMSVLAELHALGLSLSIDDFGTGYSSMSYLRRLPVDELKVDRSFVMSMTSAEQDAMLVRTAIDLGHNLGLTVVAEGVEGPEHVSALRALGCDVAQGFHYARPMPPEAITAMLASTVEAARPAGV